MDNRPIGVFDSGLGGLTTVRELRKILPEESIVYFGDTGRVPYGTRGREIIRKYSRQDIRFLLSKNVKCVIVACNTITAAMANELSNLPVPCIEVLTPAVQAARASTKNKRIAVICTSATLKSGAYQQALEENSSGIQVMTTSCPLFVPLVENGFTEPENPVTRLVAEQYLAPVREFGADTLILGCTHYPIIQRTLSAIMGEQVTLIDSGREAARAARTLLTEQSKLCAPATISQHAYFVSDSAEDFAESARSILGHEIDGVAEQIDIEAY